MLLLRVAFGFMILFNHGIPKLMKFATLSSSFYDPFGIGSKWVLILVIFAEVFCAILSFWDCSPAWQYFPLSSPCA
jgi:putative oxidoreductase